MQKNPTNKYVAAIALFMLSPGLAYSQQATAPNAATQSVSVSRSNGGITATVNGAKVTVPYHANGVHINTLNKGVGVFVSGIQTSP